MKRLSLLRQLEIAVNELHATTNNFALDQKSHKHNIDKNKVTREHWEAFVASTRLALELLPPARAEVESDPTPRNLRRLQAREREARVLIAPYDQFTVLLPPTTD